MPVSNEKMQGVHVVFGAGALGLAVARGLVNKGYQVRIVNRKGNAEAASGIEVVRGDASDPEQTRSICKDAAVIYNCVGVDYNRWPELFPAIMKGLIEGAAAADAKLVFGDNLYAYGPPSGPVKESLPNQPVGSKTKTRAEIADMLLAAHKEGKVRTVIGRAPSFYGPNVREATLGYRVMDSALKGKTASVIGNIDLPHTQIYIDDFAQALITLAEHDDALGEIWHCPAAETLTTRQLIEMVYKEVGQKPKIQIAGPVILKIMGWFNPIFKEFKEMSYQTDAPFIVDHSKFAERFGTSHITPHAEAIRRTLESYRNEAAS
jgi:nucleoside-diphosphate-sugar epimerase